MVDKLAEDIREAGEEDQDYKRVKKWLCDKYQAPKEEVTENLNRYFQELDKFSLDDNGLLCYNDRVVIPKSLRARYVDHLVHLHASPEKMKARARRSVWWPGMNAQIDEKWRHCRTCVERSPSNKPEPTKPREISKYPFQILHMDLGSYAGCQFLIIVDQFSGWPVVKNLKKDMTTGKLTRGLTEIFEHYGLPETIYSDGGPQFTSDEFDQFCKEWKINHVTSSPHYPQSNGIAENGVKAMKKLIHCSYDPIRGCVDPDEWTKAMMIYKNTPRGKSNLAPSEILFGKLIRDGFPTNYDNYIAQHKAAAKRRWDEIKRYMDQLYEFRKSSSKIRMDIGDKVFIQDPTTKRWRFTGTIEKKGRNEREFWVRTDRGGLWRRNRRFLKLQDPVKRLQNFEKKGKSAQQPVNEKPEPKMWTPGSPTSYSDMAKLPPKPIIKQDLGATRKSARVTFASNNETRMFINTEEEQEYRRSVMPSLDREDQGRLRRGTRQRRQPERWGYNQF